jgi:hypothetical protein
VELRFLQHKLERNKMPTDPAWLKALKKEAQTLGVPLRDLLVKAQPKKVPNKAKTMNAAKGGMAKKK